MKLITTSWDDGHPADERLAELLGKYKLEATFYIPKMNAEHPVMSENLIRQLAECFEIGGHTLHHTRIKSKSALLFGKEISGCYSWLSEVLPYKPESFCFPGGIYNKEAVEYTLSAGFNLIRTTELLSFKIPYKVPILPTTIQVYDHSPVTYIQHLLKRKKLRSLQLYMRIGSISTLEKLVANYINHLLDNDGCFHLWGHSWEIERYGLWTRLEDIFKIISGISEVRYVTNKSCLNYNDTL